MIKQGGIDFSKHTHTHNALGVASSQASPPGADDKANRKAAPSHLASQELVVPFAEKLTSSKVIDALLSRYPELRREMLADEAEESESESSVGGVAVSILGSSRNPAPD